MIAIGTNNEEAFNGSNYLQIISSMDYTIVMHIIE